MFGTNVSDQYVRDLLLKYKLTAHKRIQKPLLTKRHLNARRAYYNTHKGKTYDEFKNYIFTDRSSFALIGIEKGNLYYRTMNSKAPTKSLIKTSKFGGGKLMI